MLEFKEDRLIFSFPQNTVAKYDETAFYQQFKRTGNGIKAVDFIYTDRTSWFIEVKDYRKLTKEIQHQPTEIEPKNILPSQLSEAVAKKVFDTLQGIEAAKDSPNSDIYYLSKIFLQKAKKVVLHLEQDTMYKKFRPIDPADILQQLKKLLRQVDSNPYVVNCDNLSKKIDINWSVQSQ